MAFQANEIEEHKLAVPSAHHRGISHQIYLISHLKGNEAQDVAMWWLVDHGSLSAENTDPQMGQI